MTMQKAMTALDQVSNELDKVSQSFKDECRLFREEMHKGFDSLHKHFDEIDRLLDSTLDNAKAIGKYIDFLFNFIFFTIGILAFYAFLHPH